jgi:hypothetical protein
MFVDELTSILENPVLIAQPGGRHAAVLTSPLLAGLVVPNRPHYLEQELILRWKSKPQEAVWSSHLAADRIPAPNHAFRSASKRNARAARSEVKRQKKRSHGKLAEQLGETPHPMIDAVLARNYVLASRVKILLVITSLSLVDSPAPPRCNS